MPLDEYEPQWMRNRTCATRLMLIDHTKSLTVWWYLRSSARRQSESDARERSVRVAHFFFLERPLMMRKVWTENTKRMQVVQM